MPEDKESLAPTVKGTWADDIAFVLTEGIVPLINASVVPVSLLSGLYFGIVTIDKVKESDQWAIPFGLSGSLITLAATAYRSSGEKHADRPARLNVQEQPPPKNPPALTPTVDMQRGEQGDYQPKVETTGPITEPTTEQPSQEGAKSWSSGEGFGFLRNSSEYDAEMALVSMRRIQANVEQAYDGFPQVD